AGRPPDEDVRRGVRPPVHEADAEGSQGRRGPVRGEIPERPGRRPEGVRHQDAADAAGTLADGSAADGREGTGRHPKTRQALGRNGGNGLPGTAAVVRPQRARNGRGSAPAQPSPAVTARSPSAIAATSGRTSCRTTRPSRRNTSVGQSLTRNE